MGQDYEYGASRSEHRRQLRQAVILVGGRGTRLGELAANVPKPLMPITQERTFLDFLLHNVARHGVTEILLLAGHLGEQIFARYEGRRVLGATVSVVVEPQAAGTAGALHHAAAKLQPTFFLLNGDGFLDVNLLALSAAPLPPGGGRIALREVGDAARYGRVRTDGDRITAFEEKRPSRTPGLINGGVYWLDRRVLNRIHRLPCSLETEIFPRMIKDGVLSGIRTEGYFIDIGLPETLEQAGRDLAKVERRPAAFFDRDGTLNLDEGYTHEPDRLEWIPGAVESIRRFNDAGWYVVVCTNQAGLAHGRYNVDQMHAFHAQMSKELADAGAHVDAFYYSPFHPEAVVEHFRHPNHPDRKPNPGMFHRALADLPIDAGASFMVGDRIDDVTAAQAAGLRGVLFEGNDLLVALETAGLFPSTRHFQ